jgi:hypothetical protein
VMCVRNAVRPSQSAIPLRFLHSQDAFAYVTGTDDGFVLALDTTAQVGALLDRPVTTRQATTLRCGGMLLWEDAREASRALGTVTASRPATQTPLLSVRRRRLRPVA